jgi:hypothetical protein
MLSFITAPEKRSKMSTRARVISFSRQHQDSEVRPSFSAHDERLIRSALAVLDNETKTPTLDYEARARLYFYLGLHRHIIDRWLKLLLAENSAYSCELADQIQEAFQYLTSSSILDSNAPIEATYHRKLVTLSGNMFSCLRLVRSHRCRNDHSD